MTMRILLPIHIVAAGLALGTGFVALFAAKGATLHRKSGMLFVVAMTTMCSSAVVIAAVKGQTVNLIVALMTAYLVITGLTTVKPSAASPRRLAIGLMVVALVLGLTTLTFGVEAADSASGELYGYPPFPLFMIATAGLLGSAGDFRVMRSGALRGAPRLVRHLWRMCLALWMTTVSFFLNRSRVATIFPEAFLSVWVRALPVLLVLLAMLYWLWRVRVSRRPTLYSHLTR
jgi:uncharacterized membrane protein